MRQARILIASAFSAFFKPGGGEAEAASLCQILNNQGFSAEIYGPESPGLESFDFVIFFSCHHSGIELLSQCQELGVKFILWPNFWPSINLAPTEETRKTVERLVNGAERVVFKSEAEINAFRLNFALDENRVVRINWFIDQDFATCHDADRFRSIYDVNNFILSVGLIEPTKNQLSLVQAAEQAKTNIVLIGGYRNKSYFEDCKFAGKEHAIFIPHLPQSSEVLKSAYSACSVYAEASYDPPGRSAIEAYSFGKSLVLSDSSWSREIFHNIATLVDPSLVQSIHDGLVSASRKNREYAIDKRFLDSHSSGRALTSLIGFLRSSH